MNTSIQHARAVIPVTAVAITNLGSRALLVAGEGSQLKVFDEVSGVVLTTKHVFQTEVIHGIQCRHTPDNLQTRCLVWGGKSITICKLFTAEEGQEAGDVELVHVLEEWRCTDWISDASFSSHFVRGTNEERSLLQAVFLTSHNVLYSLRLNPDVEQRTSLSASSTLLAAGPSSVLYSAHVLVRDTGQVFVAAGTVFGEVLFWSYNLKHNRAQSQISEEGQLLCSFLGHEGSVFGVRISEAPLESNPLWVIASCSDDRTIRVWDVSDTLRNSPEPKSVLETIKRVDTGFGSETLQRQTHLGSCLATVMGHSSRIWDVRFVKSPDAICKLISAGEDATCQTWLMTENQLPEDASTHALRAQASHDYHIGKNVWGIAVRDEVDGSSLILTGGADGRIVLYRIPNTSTLTDSRNVQRWTAEPFSIRSASYSRRSPAGSQAKQAFTAMEGSWTIHRVLRSAIPTYPSGTFTGTASMMLRDPTDEEYDAEYLYIEEGELMTEQGLCIKGSRSYVYRFQDATDSITAWFVKTDNSGEVDYLFHRVEFDKTSPEEETAQNKPLVTANGHHLCVNDTYNAEYNFEYRNASVKSWRVKYEVKGPKKDYIADATYIKTLDTPNQGEDLPYRGKFDRAYKDKQPVPRNMDSFKTYCWLGPNELICSTAQGKVLHGILEINTGITNPSAAAIHNATQTREVSWDLVDTLPELASYSIVTSICDHTVLFGAACGTIYRCRKITQALQPIQKLPRKIAGIFAEELVHPSQADPRVVAAVVSCLGDSSAYCFFLNVDDEGDNAIPELNSLQLPSNFVVTSACFMTHDDLLVLGSRSGDLAFYDRSSFSVDTCAATCYCILHVHGGDAVTVIKDVPGTGAEFTGHFVLTAGRDGKFAMHRIRVERAQAPTEIELDTVHTSEPPFGPNIEGATFDSANNDLLLWGFCSMDFVVWNESTRNEVMRVSCGGAHRNWAYSHSDDGLHGGRFVWTKASTCNVHMQSQASHRILQPGNHGREIKAMAISPLRQDLGGRMAYVIATGGEDTTIRISLIGNSDSSEAFKCLRVISKHNTGLQHLQWSPDGRYLFSAGGREELYIWRLQPVPILGIGFTCQLQGPTITDSLELRVMDFDIAVVQGEYKLAPASDYLISVVYSNSTVRVWYFTASSLTPRLDLLTGGTYTTSCLTQIKAIHLETECFLLTAGTDGHIAFWPMTQALSEAGITNTDGFRCASHPSAKDPEILTQWTSRHLIHQNSIKCLTVLPLSSSEFILATGGDDNAIAFTRLIRPLEPSAPPVCSTLLIPRAHASTVAGIQVLDTPVRIEAGALEFSFRLVSVSSDQRLKTWNLSVDLGKPGIEGLKVRKEGNVHSSIADASCVEVMHGEGGGAGVMVAGIGMETWRIGDQLESNGPIST